MKFGIAIRNMGPQSTAAAIRACALAAEQIGFDALFVSDHLCIPPGQTEGSGGRYLDVLATLAFIAGATQRIRLGISVLVLPYRPAVFTAKLLATIQELSAERMILGVGSGWMREEFDALGVDFKKRGAIATETLRVIRHLFANEAEPYRGELISFPAFVFKPRPVARVKREAAARGKTALEIVARSGFPIDDTARARERLAQYAHAGVTYVIVDLGRYADCAQFIREAEKFMAEIVPA